MDSTNYLTDKLHNLSGEVHVIKNKLVQQTEDFEDELQDIQNDVDANTNNLSTLSTAVQNNASNISSLSSRVGVNESNISNNTNNISSLTTTVQNLSGSISNLIPQGGSLSAPLTVDGGTSSTAGKLLFGNDGAITDSNSNMLLGQDSTQPNHLFVGSSAKTIHIKGATTRIKYNSDELALKSDVPSTFVTSINGSSGAITKVPIQSSTTTTADKVLLSTTTANSVSWSSSAKGSTTKPVYLNSSGVLSEGSTYAGGTAVTLNGTSKSGSTASFYAPTGAGTSGQVLKSNGSGAPSWTDLYPVGAVYLSTVNTSPASVFGGTWAQISQGYALWTTTTANTGGQTISAGLPNITGQPDVNFVSHSSQTMQNGALTYVRKGAQGGLSGSGIQYGQIKIDASQSNSIYGNSTTVQPPAYRIYAWRRTA